MRRGIWTACALSVVGALGVSCTNQVISEPDSDASPESLELVWTESAEEPVVLQVHRQVRQGNAPDEYRTETGVRWVRRDLAEELTGFDEKGDARSIEQLAQDRRVVTLIDGVEYISDPDYEAARLEKEGVSPPSGTPPSPNGAGTEHHEEWAQRIIIGADNRYSLDPVARLYPDRTQVQHFNGVGSMCSGTMVGRYTQATAAHCLHDGSSWIAPVRHQRAGQGSAGAVWTRTSCGSFCACWFLNVSAGWDTWQYNGDDYASVDFRGCDIPDAGWLGTSNSMGWDRTHYLNGYPFVTPSGPAHRLWGANNGSAHWHTGYSNWFFHEIDTTDGQSGSGIYRKFGSDRRVVAIHAGSIGLTYNENRGRQVDSSVWVTLIAGGLCQTPGYENCP